MEIKLEGHYSRRRLVLSSLPNVLMMIVGSVYSIVDGLFVSNFVGTTSFAAINLVWPAIMIVGSLGLMTGTGGSALVSMTMGQGNMPRANRFFSLMVRLTLVCGVFLGFLLFVSMRPLVMLLGAEGDLVGECIKYGRICACGLPAFMLQLMFQSFYMTAEKPQLGTVMSIACGVTNMALDALFIIVFKWGIVGAAVASMLACCVGGLFPLWWFSSRHNTSSLHIVGSRTCRRENADWKHERREAVRRSCTNGLSEYVGNITFSIVGICYNLQLMRYLGENGVAAYGILMYIGYVFAAVIIGYNMTAAPLVGYNYGRGDGEELSSLLRKSLSIMLVAGLLMTLLAEVTAVPASKVFVSYDPELLDITVHALRIYMLSFLICGVNMFTSAWFTGLNNGVISAVAAFTRSMVFELGAVFALPALVGIDGIWMAVDVAEILALILSFSLLAAFRRRYHYHF